MTAADDTFNSFVKEVDMMIVSAAAEITALEHSLRAKHGSDGIDSVVDDALADISGSLAARAANAVADHEADEAIDQTTSRFSAEISNGSLERRLAAVLIFQPAETICS